MRRHDLLEGLASLTLELPLGHPVDQLPEFFLGKMGADFPQSPSYVVADCFLSQRTKSVVGRAGLAVLF